MIYDLTTRAGCDDVFDHFPLLKFLKWLFEKLFGSSAPSADEQRRLALEMIKAAKESGVKSIDFTISSEAWSGFVCPVECAEIKAGRESKGVINVHIDFY